MYISEAVNKAGSASQATEHPYVTGFRHFPHESVLNSCLDSSAPNREVNPSASVQISMSACAKKSRNSSEKCNGYPCQVLDIGQYIMYAAFIQIHGVHSLII